MAKPVTSTRQNSAQKLRTAQIFEALAAENPEPKGELHFTNPYTLLVAVALSAQATDIGVNKATLPLFKIIATPYDMIALGEERLIEHIKTIGLYRTKAANVMKAAEMLIKDYQGEVPNQREALETLPGVGRKTANVVLNIAFDQHTIAVDTHLFRLAHRLGLSKGKTPLAVELDLLKLIPDRFMKHAHHWLILHGRYVCKAKQPKCASCCLQSLCPSYPFIAV